MFTLVYTKCYFIYGIVVFLIMNTPCRFRQTFQVRHARYEVVQALNRYILKFSALC